MSILVEVRAFLIAQTIATAPASSIFIGDLPPDPEVAIAVLLVGGSAPEPTMELQYGTFSLLVRGARNGYASGYALAEKIRQAVHGGSITPSWVYCYSSAGTIFIGYDETRRPLFSLNFRSARPPIIPA